jgi:predicted Na+-dependent transporter
LTILLPLVIGAAIRHFADSVATKIHPGVKKFALIATLLTTVWCLVIYGQSMLDTAGEFALLSLVLFMVGMALMTYNLSLGLKQSQRSIMALGLSTLNGAALFAATTTIPNADPRIGAMTVMWILVSIPLAALATRIFAKKAEAGAVA